MSIKSVIILLVGLVAFNAPAMNAPDFRCVAVAANGDVTLTWLTPPDPGATFTNYQIYSSSNQSGPYALTATVLSYAQTSYVNAGAGANTGSKFYYIKTCYGPGTNYSNSSDTLQSIFLNVTNLADGTATLSWNSIRNPNLPSSSGLYKIYREYPAGIWTLVGNTTKLNYKDTITICHAFLNYQVDIDDLSGCTSISSIDGDIFSDIISPNTPIPISVTVNPATGIASISWNQSTSGDTKGYIIYKLNNGSWIPLDTIYGINNTNFTNLTSNAGSQSESYRLAALDSCKNISIQGIIHKTIYVTAILDRCNSSNTIKWNKYINMSSGVGSYKIYVSENGNPFNLLATNSGIDSTYIHTGLANLSNYCYYIEADNVLGTITSISNRFCINTNLPKTPKFSYLRKATVASKNSVSITCYVDNTAGVSHYAFKRSGSNAGTYTIIGTVPFSLSSSINFVDNNTVQTNAQSYFYKVCAVDSCSNELDTTNIGRTILLNATGNDDFTNTLTWNDYEQWSGSTASQSYNIFRSTSGTFNSPPIANIPYGGGSGYTYIDNISNSLNGEGTFYYYIEALEGNGNIYGFQDTSKSNIAEARQNSLFYIPNAFVPSGLNKIFIPISTFVITADYSFTIYDRWGEKIFETNDITIGWDGTFKSSKCQPGVYVYSIEYKNSQGENQRTKGIVTLVR